MSGRGRLRSPAKAVAVRRAVRKAVRTTVPVAEQPGTPANKEGRPARAVRAGRPGQGSAGCGHRAVRAPQLPGLPVETVRSILSVFGSKYSIPSGDCSRTMFLPQMFSSSCETSPSFQPAALMHSFTELRFL